MYIYKLLHLDIQQKLIQHCKLSIVVQLPSHVWLVVTPWTSACQTACCNYTPVRVNFFKCVKFNQVLGTVKVLLVKSLFFLISTWEKGKNKRKPVELKRDALLIFLFCGLFIRNLWINEVAKLIHKHSL